MNSELQTYCSGKKTKQTNTNYVFLTHNDFTSVIPQWSPLLLGPRWSAPPPNDRDLPGPGDANGTEKPPPLRWPKSRRLFGRIHHQQDLTDDFCRAKFLDFLIINCGASTWRFSAECPW